MRYQKSLERRPKAEHRHLVESLAETRNVVARFTDGSPDEPRTSHERDIGPVDYAPRDPQEVVFK